MKFRKLLIIIWLNTAVISISYGQIDFVSNDTMAYTKLMFVGDIPVNKMLIESSYDAENDKYNFQDLFYFIRPILNLGDIVAGNLETTVGTEKFGMYPTYNVPEEFLLSLKFSGFNLVMNANSKAVNQDEAEWRAHKKLLEEHRIEQTGSFLNDEDRYERNPTIIEEDGIKNAFLNYMVGIDFFDDVSPIVNAAVTENIEKDIELAKLRGADFITVYFHWGKEFQKFANVTQQNLANFCVEQGANLVLGSHPHIVQDVNVRETINQGQIGESVIAYSLGDFYTTANSVDVNSTFILEVIVCKDKRTNYTSICSYGYIPTYTYQYKKNGKYVYSILPVSQVEKGNITTNMTNAEYSKMIASADKVRYKASYYLEEIQYELSDAIIADVAEVLRVTKRPLNETRDFALERKELLLAYSGFLDTATVVDVPKPAAEGVTYKVQFLALKNKIPIDLRYYEHLEGYEIVYEDGLYKYLIGNEKSIHLINNFCLDIKRNGHKNAFVVTYKDGIRIGD